MLLLKKKNEEAAAAAAATAAASSAAAAGGAVASAAAGGGSSAAAAISLRGGDERKVTGAYAGRKMKPGEIRIQKGASGPGRAVQQNKSVHKRGASGRGVRRLVKCAR